MCNFKSALVLRDESLKGGFKLIMSPWTESHSELCVIHGVKDNASSRRVQFARVEFSPPSLETAHQVETYKLKIDEERTPEWFDEEMKEAVTSRMTTYIKSIIVDGDVALLIGGQFIIAPGAKVESAQAIVINAMCGGTLNAMCGGTLNAMCGGTLNAMCGGTLNEMWGGTLNEMWGGTLNAMWGGTLNAMCGGTLNAMRGGTLNEMRGGTLNEMWGGTLNEMWGGTLNAMRGGTLNEMWGGVIREIVSWFSGLIGKRDPDAIVLKDNRPTPGPATK